MTAPVAVYWDGRRWLLTGLSGPVVRTIALPVHRDTYNVTPTSIAEEATTAAAAAGWEAPAGWDVRPAPGTIPFSLAATSR